MEKNFSPPFASRHMQKKNHFLLLGAVHMEEGEKMMPNLGRGVASHVEIERRKDTPHERIIGTSPWCCSFVAAPSYGEPNIWRKVEGRGLGFFIYRFL